MGDGGAHRMCTSTGGTPMTTIVLCGDARTALRGLPDGCVQCVVTSPPFFNLRDYGTATWSGGDPACDHVVGAIRTGLGLAKLGEQYRGGGHKASEPKPMTAKGDCPRCGALRIDQQIGLEKSPEEYIAEIVAVFREVRRVMRADAIAWLNLGDSFASSTKGTGGDGTSSGLMRDGRGENGRRSKFAAVTRQTHAPTKINHGAKAKDLLMMPARVALALQADGWWLRSDIIWHKVNPMPESITDRPTSCHEHVFMLTRSPKYFFDAEAVKEVAAYPNGPNAPSSIKSPHGQGFTRKALRNATESRHRASIPGGQSMQAEPNGTRNIRNVWTIATTPFPGAHFACFPQKLVEPCIKAATSEKGRCSVCGAPFRRIMEKGAPDLAHQIACGSDAAGAYDGEAQKNYADAGVQNASDVKRRILAGMVEKRTIGWKPTCLHVDAKPIPCLVLDCFGGAGTTGIVANRLGRDAILYDLNPAYVTMAEDRIEADELKRGIV